MEFYNLCIYIVLKKCYFCKEIRGEFLFKLGQILPMVKF